MFRRERYTPLVGTAALLTVATLVTFQFYLWREPARLQADAAADLEAAVREGETLYAELCASCHGDQGQGGLGPALNAKSLLTSTSDGQLSGLIRTGVPGTAMPAWGQNYGGPLTDEHVRQVVAHLRSWEAQASDVAPPVSEPDPERGAEIFESICFACHGRQGEGSDRGPALNDRILLTSFDDDWFRETIAQGRPSRGMPTWGTVLSPEEIDDLVALLALWREGKTVAQTPTTGETAGADLYAAACAGCHGTAGEGGVGPGLVGNEFLASQNEAGLAEFIMTGRSGTAMTGFRGRLKPDEVAAIVELLRSWQP